LAAHCAVGLHDQPGAICRGEAPRCGQAGPDCRGDRLDWRRRPRRGSGLKVVANIAVGYDNIDVAAAKARGGRDQHAGCSHRGGGRVHLGLIFSVTRRIVEGDRLVRRGGWKGWALDFMLGTEMGGKQLAQSAEAG
jgi:glyoxylate reductase